jgi:hypothetical protein
MVLAPPQHAGQLAEAWARKLATLRDHSVQVGWVRSELEHVGAARAADVLCVVLARAEQREERYSTLLLRVSLALSNPLSAPLKAGIAALAAARGQGSLARFLGHSERPPESDLDGDAEPEKERDVPDFGTGRPLSLGERKSLARTHDRNLLARVLRDPHPDVIRVLLDNPAVVEADIVRLCARRPARAQVLSEVFLHQRWVLRYRVRVTLALNPFTPEEITLQLLPHLAPSDLRAVRTSSQISQRVRDACSDKNEEPLH